MSQSPFAAGVEVIILTSGWSRSPGQFAKVERLTPAGWIIVNGSTFQPDREGAATAVERGGRRRLRIATAEDRLAEELHLMDLKAGRLQEHVNRVRVRDLDRGQSEFIIAAFEAILYTANMVGIDPPADIPRLANPVAWEREGSNGWVTVAPEDLDHYRGKGQRIRALGVIQEDQG